MSEADIIFQYDKAKHDQQVAGAPWKKDVHFYKHTQISALALVKMVMHARQGGNLEVMGCLQGKVDGDTIIVMDSFALPVEAVETRVNAAENAGPWMVQYLELQKQVGREENVIGWYHSHPGFGCWLSGIDVQTQSIHQRFSDPWLAIVVDPKQTMSSGKVALGAFRTYPDDYKPPDEGPSEYQPIPLDKIEDFGVHSKKYYTLDVTYFKSSLDSYLLNLLWDKYWINTLSSSPLITNRDYAFGQMNDLAEKLDKEHQLVHVSKGNAH
eukprot:TRINITY_DN777_c0_g1_i2.p1 TRINITY_DN777_c0_g1~~TRINITY_DN777_c0_g1_i2.p1  ORF type:complete len:268 (-),score=46.16 TRINITY_DN777_c0_g1_i2:308-1111(-)